MRDFINIIEQQNVNNETKFEFLKQLAEKAPPGKKAKNFIKHRKADFQERYGDAWKEVLYATANKLFHKKKIHEDDNEEDGSELVNRPVKAWFNAKTGKVIPMDFYDKHFEVARRNRRRMDIPDDAQEMNIAAVENGWVRISSNREVSSDRHGYITARDSFSARKGLRWMQDNGCLPETMDVEFYTNGNPSDFFTLTGDDLYRFIDRGIKPR